MFYDLIILASAIINQLQISSFAIIRHYQLNAIWFWCLCELYNALWYKLWTIKEKSSYEYWRIDSKFSWIQNLAS